MNPTINLSYKRPSNNDLIVSAPLEMWRRAEQQAKRSTLGRFRTGAVIFDKKGRELGVGCSHLTENPLKSVHAEEHALSKVSKFFRKSGSTCLIVTLSRSDSFAGSSRPCARCFNILNRYNIEYVVWAERCNDSSWHIHKESVREIQSVIKDYDLTQQFAKKLRVV